MNSRQRKTYGIIFLLLLITEVCIALFIKDNFIRPYIGDVLVTVLICCFLRAVIPKKVKALPIYVFIFAAAVEAAQYFDIVKLLGLENVRFVSVIVGRTFSFHDILCYAIGCALFAIAEYTVKATKKGLMH